MMFSRLVQKELVNYLLDLRFVVVFALCALLSALSVYIGGQNYVRQLKEYSETMGNHRQTLQAYIENKQLVYLRVVGERWNRRPEVLSPVVYGLSGKLGQEVLIQYQTLPKFEASLFEEDPIYAIFGVLDLAFVVKIVLSICVLLFTYDAICGEKEGGTLRLFFSFQVVQRQHIVFISLRQVDCFNHRLLLMLLADCGLFTSHRIAGLPHMPRQIPEPPAVPNSKCGTHSGPDIPPASRYSGK